MAVAPEPSATVRNTADGEEAHQGARRRHENSRCGAKTGLPIHAPTSRESCAEGIDFYKRALAQLNLDYPSRPDRRCDLVLRDEFPRPCD